MLQSKLESAKTLKQYVTKDVLLSIRKTGRYDHCINHKYSNVLTFKIENETDLHIKLVSFLKKRYAHSLLTVTLGDLHKHYTGFSIEFKSPKGNGVLSPDQSMILLQY